VCYGLEHDEGQKAGQIAHLDHDPSNNAVENLVFLCLAHHDQYDSTTSQSKGLSLEEVRRHQSQLRRFVTESLPLSASEIVHLLLACLDRPAFRTPFHMESSLPQFRTAIAESIRTINAGTTSDGKQLPSKFSIADPKVRNALDQIVQQLVAIRAFFDELLKSGEITPCGCGKEDCHTFMFTDMAVAKMDSARRVLLTQANALDHGFPSEMYTS
jgi:hypothetical protein